MSENYRTFDTVYTKLGEIDVTGWRVLGNKVRIGIDGLIEVGFELYPREARAIAAQLIAAADYAEGV